MHTCHATGCPLHVPERMFLCKTHWFRLPKPLRDRIWATYVDGQEERKDPSRAYCQAAIECVRYLAAYEGRTSDTRLYEMLMPEA